MKKLQSLIVLALLPLALSAQGKSLHQLQQEFVDLRFGMFVHFGLQDAFQPLFAHNGRCREGQVQFVTASVFESF